MELIKHTFFLYQLAEYSRKSYYVRTKYYYVRKCNVHLQYYIVT